MCSTFNCSFVEFRFLGAANGIHEKFGAVCVATFAHYAGEFVTKIPKLPPPPTSKSSAVKSSSESSGVKSSEEM